MGFFDKVKKAFGSKKEDESQNSDENSVDNKISDKVTSLESLKNDNQPHDFDESKSKHKEKLLKNIENAKIFPQDKISLRKKVLNNKIKSEKELNDILVHLTQKYILNKENSELNNDAKNLNKNNDVKNWFESMAVGTTISSSTKTIKNDKKNNKKVSVKQIKNFKYLDDLIHSGVKEIVLDSNIFLSNDEKSKYLDGINLDVDDLVIDGNGHKIDAKGKTRIFICSGKNVLLKNIRLLNGFNEEKGGAIFNIGDLTIIKSTLNKNIAGRGGAIYNYNSKLIIKESTINNNNTDEEEGNGGAINNEMGDLTITESTLQENRVNGTFSCGGAIHNEKGNSTINGCIFNQNKASSCGGAISYKEGNSAITESTFYKNIAWSRGGAIHSNEGKIIITKSKLNKNSAHTGGVIYQDKGNLTINESLLIHNAADRTGGAIESFRSELTIVKSVLQENSAEYDGGVIYTTLGNSEITESILQENIAQRGGGAITNDGSTFTITKSIINRNVGKEYGGAIYNYKGNYVIVESSINENTAKNGGAIYNRRGNLKISKAEISENVAKEINGIIYHDVGDLRINNCEIFKNHSLNNLISNKDSLEISNSNFKNNSSKYFIVNEGEISNLSLLNGKFKDNQITESIIFNRGRFCTIENFIFENNLSNNQTKNIINQSELTLKNPKIIDEGKTVLNKGIIFIKNSSSNLKSKIDDNGKVEIFEVNNNKFDFGYLDNLIHESNTKEIVLNEDISFENYEIDYYEGGIELDIDDLVIDGNGRTIDGAGRSRIFIITGKNIMLKNITFQNGFILKNMYFNPINANGGALRCNFNSSLTLENCKFINNASENNGGAIQNFGELTIYESTLQENTAHEFGGAIYNFNELSIFESTIKENISKCGDKGFYRKKIWGGGAIYNTGSLTINNCMFNHNIANYDGGAIYNYEGNLSIKKSVINNNAANGAYDKGCAICNYLGELTILRSKLNQNINLAINNMKGSSTITECIFNQNSRAIHNEGLMMIKKSMFNKNTGRGAIYNNGELSIVGSTFTENTSDNWGGAIQSSAKISISDSTFTENTAQEYGGAIYVYESKYESENCTFKDNKPDDVYKEND